jgi:N-acetylglucosaminyldiphosphoundecaprenol N-acetyl-beta-D-mannosaminyltransferase
MKKKIISLDITIGQYSSFIETIIDLGKKNQSSYVCFANVHMTIEAYFNKDFSKMVNEADLVSPDGMPISKVIKLLYGIKQPRVAGMDVLPDILKKAEDNDLGVFFYGGTHEMLKKTKDFVDLKYPNLKMHTYFSPPFRNLNEEEEILIINKINDSNANIVLVALGCPKQEKWIARMKGKINACMLGIGGALPVMIGIQKRSPKWMQKLSLEWLYRLIIEPKRLFKRYFITNSTFIYLVLLKLIKSKLFCK